MVMKLSILFHMCTISVAPLPYPMSIMYRVFYILSILYRVFNRVFHSTIRVREYSRILYLGLYIEFGRIGYGSYWDRVSQYTFTSLNPQTSRSYYTYTHCIDIVHGIYGILYSVSGGYGRGFPFTSFNPHAAHALQSAPCQPVRSLGCKNYGQQQAPGQGLKVCPT